MASQTPKVQSNFKIKDLLRQEQDEGLLDLVREHCLDTGTMEEFDLDTAKNTCINYRHGLWQGKMCIFIAYLGEEPVGYTVGEVSQALHKKTVIGEQKILFVTKRLRGTLLAVRLLQSFEQWARTYGAAQIFTGTVNELYSERTSQFLERLGHRKVGTLHVKEL